MENAANLSGSGRKLNAEPVIDLDESTKDASDFEQHFSDNSDQNISDTSFEKAKTRPVLMISIPNGFKELNHSETILSPISDLALIVANTKLQTSSSSGFELVKNNLADINEAESMDSYKDPTLFAFAAGLKSIKHNDAFDTGLAMNINSSGMLPSPRSHQRRLNIAPLNLDDTSNSPVKMSSEEMSLYSGNTPQGSPRPCSINSCLDIGMLSPLRESETIESRHDIDYSSMDSGYSNNSQKMFTFVQPIALPPKPSPPKAARLSPTSISCFRSFNSLSSDSMESMDDDCMDLMDMESMDDNAQLPTSFNSIISGNIKSTSTATTTTPVFRRCLSMTDGNVHRGLRTPEHLKPIPEADSSFHGMIKTFKRPEPPTIGSPVQSKRYKQSAEDKENSNDLPSGIRPPLRKSMSMNDDIIMNALSRSSSEPHLIGDFSRPFSLPLMEGRHSDLKSISVHTMAKLLRGEYQDSIASFKVIDCRYPYEFEGGHIRDAQNFYTHEQILTELVNSKTGIPKLVSDEPKRNIIVFHCEFSSERGPKLSRFLRNNDRSRNEHAYPALHYPEIYLLHGGYKDFFEAYPELCDPINYRQMLDPDYTTAYRQFRAKSKSWNGDQKKANRLVKSKSRNLIYQ